jgi:hypothetical protein
MCNSPAKILLSVMVNSFVLWSSNLGIFHLECVCSRMRTAFLSRFSLQDSRRYCSCVYGLWLLQLQERLSLRAHWHKRW